ncbi:MAG: 16S rRNA (guanine(527)-N(7))-methyltransferase RsmG [Pseudohongiellaceae bacterium]|nr:16S rRNA (guanine(527)-N(7))-methyltransferase RsmG [Pseudohongiellaceae bacterium]
MSNNELASELQRGLDGLKLSLSDTQQDLLLQYLALLLKWNKAFNLSGVKTPSEMLTRHILDSLSVVPFITGQCVLDVGTGPGLPGIPLAICYPDKQFVLLDSNGKKTRFIFQALVQLGLKNVDVENTRIEALQSEKPIDTIVSRAFSSIVDFLSLTQHIVKKSSKPVNIVAMKGLYPEAELAQLPNDYVLKASTSVKVPGHEAARHIIEITTKDRSST